MCDRTMTAVWMMMCAMLLAGTAFAAAPPPAVALHPQEIAWTSGGEAWLDAGALRVGELPEAFAGARAAHGRAAAKLGTAANAKTLRVEQGTLPERVPARTRAEGYALAVGPDGGLLTAETAHGAHNGLVTLAGLVGADGRVPCVAILDWPDQEMRGTYAPSANRLEERFDQIVALKLNLLVLEDGGLFSLEQPEMRERFQKLAERCRENFIEFVPELQSLGWGQFVLQRVPQAVEARWVERRSFPVSDGRVFATNPPLPPAPEVLNTGFAAGMEGWKAQTHRNMWLPSTEAEASVVPCTGCPSGHALRTVSTGGENVRVEQIIAVAPNAHYELRGMVKTENVRGNGAYIEVYGVDESGGITEHIGQAKGSVSGTTDWKEMVVPFNTGAEGRQRPGGALEGDAAGRAYERVCLFLRLEKSTGTAWFSGVEVRPVNAQNPLGNVVVTETARVEVRSADGDTLFEEGRDYTLDVPELRYPFDEDRVLGVARTPDGRMPVEGAVLLSYNQAGREDVTCCPSEPLYQEFLRGAIQNVVTHLKPKYLHIGHDEPRFFNRDQRCADRKLSNTALFVDDIKRTRDFAVEADPEIRLMIWDDAINPYQNGPNLDTSDAAKDLPRDIIVNVWWYDNDQWENQMDRSLDYFLDLGFEVTGSPWFRVPNAFHWAELFNARRDNPKALGVIYTSWEDLPNPWAALEFTAEHLWSFQKPEYKP